MISQLHTRASLYITVAGDTTSGGFLLPSLKDECSSRQKCKAIFWKELPFGKIFSYRGRINIMPSDLQRKPESIGSQWQETRKADAHSSENIAIFFKEVWGSFDLIYISISVYVYKIIQKTEKIITTWHNRWRTKRNNVKMCNTKMSYYENKGDSVHCSPRWNGQKYIYI